MRHGRAWGNFVPRPMADSAREGGEIPVVVIVDDDDLFRESLEQNLTESDFKVIGFADAPAALDHLNSNGDADLVLLDWKMAPMSGIELLRRLRESGAEVPVIFLTALSDQIYEEAALIGGAVDFVEKSRSFTILLKRIELILSGPKVMARPPASGPGSAPVRYGELALDPAAAVKDHGVLAIVGEVVGRSAPGLVDPEEDRLQLAASFVASCGSFLSLAERNRARPPTSITPFQSLEAPPVWKLPVTISNPVPVLSLIV